MSIAERIRVLMGGMTAPAFAAHIGEEKPQRLKDVLAGRQRVPEDMLIRIVERTGCDANWLLLGGARPAQQFSPRVKALVENYEATDEEGRRHIERAADLEAQSAAAGRKKAARGGQ